MPGENATHVAPMSARVFVCLCGVNVFFTNRYVRGMSAIDDRAASTLPVMAKCSNDNRLVAVKKLKINVTA